MPATTITQHDQDEYTLDMAQIARAGRQLWMRARLGPGLPEVADDELHTHNTTPGVEVFDHLVIDDEASRLLAEDIAKWVA